MVTKIWQFLTDPVVFDADFENVKTTLKAFLLTVGAMMSTGEISVGPTLWWLAPAVLGLSAFIQKKSALSADDLVAVSTSLSPEQRTAMAKHWGLTVTEAPSVPAQ